jgi:hypothetical protein
MDILHFYCTLVLLVEIGLGVVKLAWKMHMFISTEKGWKVEIRLCRGLIWVHSLGPKN